MLDEPSVGTGMAACVHHPRQASFDVEVLFCPVDEFSGVAGAGPDDRQTLLLNVNEAKPGMRVAARPPAWCWLLLRWRTLFEEPNTAELDGR